MDGSLFLAGIEDIDDAWQITCLDKYDLSEASDEQEIVEKIVVWGAKQDWPLQLVGWCEAGDDAVLQERTFPRLDGGEMKAALHWELAGKTPFDDAVAAYSCLERETGQYLLGFLRRARLEQLVGSFHQHGLHLSLVTAMQEKQRPVAAADGVFWQQQKIDLAAEVETAAWEEGTLYALGAACQLTGSGTGLDFLPVSAKAKWDWRRLSLAVAAAAFMCMAAAGGIVGWQAHEAAQEVRREEGRWELLSGEARRRSQLEDAMQDITARETKLVDITKQRASWYSLLVHLGTKTMPGVWLDGAAFHANGRLQLSGKAVDYDALAQFLSLLEQDKEIAGMKPGLERSALSQDGQLTSFAVDLGKEEQSE